MSVAGRMQPHTPTAIAGPTRVAASGDRKSLFGNLELKVVTSIDLTSSGILGSYTG